MPVTNWNQTTIDGKEFLVIDVAKLRIPLDWDPSSNVFIAVAAPTGGILNYPVLVQGDPGETPTIEDEVDFTALAPDDPTADYASFSETSPGVYQLTLGLHTGEPGEDGDTVLDPGDFDGAAPGKIIVLNSDATAFELQTPKVGDRFFPTAYDATASGNPTSTLAVVGFVAAPWDYTLECHGECIVTGTGADVRVDLFARLGTTGIATPETAGNIIGRGRGVAGVGPTVTTLIPGLPAGSSTSYDKVLAGNTASVYFRAERVSGTETFTTSNTEASFWVKVNPVP